MGACARNMYSDSAEIKPAQCCIKLVFHLTCQALIRRCDDWPATITHVPVVAVLVLNTPDDWRLRPKHVEWLCRNKTCTVLHQVGVSFDLYYDERKHIIKNAKHSFSSGFQTKYFFYTFDFSHACYRFSVSRPFNLTPVTICYRIWITKLLAVRKF